MDVLHQDGLTCLGLGHDEGALSFADGGEEVYHAGGEGVAISSFAELELFVGEEGSEVLKGHTVADEGRIASVDFRYFHQREVFLAFLGRTDDAFHHVAGLQAEELDLRLRHVDVVRRGQVVVVGRTQEAVAVLHDFQYAGAGQDVIELVGLFRFCRFSFGSRFGIGNLSLALRALLVVSVVRTVCIVVRTCDAGTRLFGSFCRKVGCVVFGGFEFANQFTGELHFFGRQVFYGNKVVCIFGERKDFLGRFFIFRLLALSGCFSGWLGVFCG